MKYTEEIKERIRELWASGEYTAKQVQEITGISKQTWSRWKIEKSDFCDLLKEAEKERYDNIRALATGGLKKLLEGHQYDEVTRELKKTADGDELVETKRVTKTVNPNPTSVIFALSNQDSKNFKQKREVEFKDTTEKEPQTKQEILERLKELDEKEKQLKGSRATSSDKRGKSKASKATGNRGRKE